MAIRPAVADDADAVFSLLAQLEKSFTPERAAFDVAFASLTGDGAQALFLVSEDKQGIVRGYALTTISPLLHTNGSAAQLQELVVDDSARGTGVGSALVERTERECRARGVRQLTVPSRRAAGFYERLGYRSTADFLKRSLD